MNNVLNLSDLALIQQVRETMSFIDAGLEPIDNAFDAKGTKNIYVDMNEEDKSFTVYNDGEPMTTEEMDAFCKNYIYHNDQNNGDPIGLMGKGGKMSAIKIGDTSDGKKAYLKLTSFSKNAVAPVEQTVEIKESKENNCLTCNGGVLINDKTKMRSLKRGQYYRIENCSDEFFAKAKDFGNAISTTYGFKYFTTRQKVFFNGEEIDYRDFMYFKVLGDRINDTTVNEGKVYHLNGLWFKVKTHLFKNDKGDQFKFQTISLYIPRATVSNKDLDSDGDMSRVGIYTYRGNRLMDHGNNITKMFSRGSGLISKAHTGGCNRCRLSINTDLDTNNYFKIQANKSEGIKSPYDNPYTNGLFRNEEGYTPYEVLAGEFGQILQMNIFERSDSKNTKVYNTITEEKAEEIFKGKYKKNIDLKVKKKTPINIALDEIDPQNAIDLICKRDKNIQPTMKTALYTLLKILRKNKVSESKIEKIINEFYTDVREQTKADPFGNVVEIKSEAV